MLNKFMIAFLFLLLPFKVYCLPDLDVRTITIDNEATMLNQGQYSLDFSETFPNLEEIIIKRNFRYEPQSTFEPDFFNQFEDDLGLSNNKNLQAIKGVDDFIKIIMKTELPQLTSLEMYFNTFNSRKYNWDWISKLE